MIRATVAACGLFLACLHSPAIGAEDAWPVPRGPSREPVPYQFDRKKLAEVPRDFLDNAIAVLLYAGMNYTVEKDGTLETTTHEVSRLNGRKAVEKLGEFRSISYAPSYQKVTLHIARLHKPDGKVIEVQPRHVHLRDVATDYQVYDPEKQLIITFPSLEVGDVLEVKWTVRGKNPEHGGRYFTRYSFGDPTYPVMRDDLRIRVPIDMPLNHATVHGKLAPVTTDADARRTHAWSKTLIPAAPKDDDLPSREELRTTVVASTFISWDQVGTWKRKIRAACWECPPRVKAVVAEVTKGCKTPLEKARALTYWVRRNVRYVSVGERHDYTPHMPDDVLSNRYGDCKDTSQLLATMLREAGLAVELATLGVLDDGQVHPDVPSPWGTHAILLVSIDGKRHWIDTTVRLAGWDLLPKDDMDRLCYVTNKDGNVRLVRTPKATAATTRTEQTTEVWIDPSGTSRCKRRVVSHGLAAIVQRDRFSEVPVGERRRAVVAEVQDANARTMLLSLDVDEGALADHDQPVKVDMVFEIPRHFTGDADKEGSFTDSRVWARLLSHNIDHERAVPLVLPGPFTSRHTYVFHLPAAYVLDGVPRSKEVKSKFGSFTTTVRVLDSDEAPRQLEVIFHTRLDKARIEVPDLDDFRRFQEEVSRDYRVWLNLKPAADLRSAERMENLLAVSPQNPFTAGVLAKLYLKFDRPADARRVLERACFYSPNDANLWDLRVSAADSPQQEEEAQRELVKRFPGKLEHALALGRILVSQGKQTDARKLLSLLTKQGTEVERARAHYQLARSHYRQDQPKEALAELEAAGKLDPVTVSSLRAFMLRAQILEDLKRPKEALNVYRLALATDAKSQEVLLAMIRLALETKDEMSALDFLRRYTLQVDRDVSGLLLAAESYLRLKRYDEAFELASRARDITFNEKGQRILGLVYLHRGDDEKAVLHLSKADPDAVVLGALIRANVSLGKLGDVESLVEKAERIDRPSEGLKLAVERGRAVLARRKELGRIAPTPDGAALDALACAEEARRRGRPFDKLLEAALKPAKPIGPALALRGRVELERGRLAKALADAEAAIAACAEDATGYYVRGRVRLERGTAGAMDDLKKAVELSGRQDADMLRALSEAQSAAGQKAEAVESARAALKLRPKDRELIDHLAALEKKG